MSTVLFLQPTRGRVRSKRRLPLVLACLLSGRALGSSRNNQWLGLVFYEWTDPFVPALLVGDHRLVYIKMSEGDIVGVSPKAALEVGYFVGLPDYFVLVLLQKELLYLLDGYRSVPRLPWPY